MPMWFNIRALIAAFATGLLGAGLATVPVSQGWFWLLYGSTYETVTRYLWPVAIAAGFLTCFFISLWFLKFMRARQWQAGIGIGILCGAIAGAIIAFILALYGSIISVSKWGFVSNLFMDCIVNPFMAAVLAAFLGGFAGMVLSLAFGPSLLRIINKAGRESVVDNG